MDNLLIVVRGYVIFVAAFGFILGQLFFNNFAWGATLAGVFGLISGAFSGRFSHKTRLRSGIIISCCVISLVGVSLDAYNYYSNLNSSGNYYAWFMIAPFCFALLVIIWHIARKTSSSNASGGASEKSS